MNRRPMQADVQQFIVRLPWLPDAKISADKDQTSNDNKRDTSEAI